MSEGRRFAPAYCGTSTPSSAAERHGLEAIAEVTRLLALGDSRR
ncbi:hypothetical protein [Streptomyces mirabilis]